MTNPKDGYTEKFQKDTVKKFIASGLKIETFCNKHDISSHLLTEWKSKHGMNGKDNKNLAEMAAPKKKTLNRYDLTFINTFLDDYEKLGDEVTIKAFASSRNVVHSTAYKWLQRRKEGIDKYQSIPREPLDETQLVLSLTKCIQEIGTDIKDIRDSNARMEKRLKELEITPNPNIIDLDFTEDKELLNELDSLCEIKKRSRVQQILYLISNSKDILEHE